MPMRSYAEIDKQLAGVVRSLLINNDIEMARVHVEAAKNILPDASTDVTPVSGWGTVSDDIEYCVFQGIKSFFGHGPTALTIRASYGMFILLAEHWIGLVANCQGDRVPVPQIDRAEKLADELIE